MNKTNKILTGSLFKQMFFFSLPLVVTNLLQVLFTMVDSMVVGLFDSSSALGSIGSASIIVVLFTGLLIGMGSGINVLVAKYIGQNHKNKLNVIIHSGFLVSLIYGVLIMIFGLLFIDDLLVILNTKDELIDGAKLYLKIYMCGMPFLALYNYGNGVYSAMGNTKKPLLYLLIAGCINVILNIVLVILLDMSVDGVAVASITAHFTAASLLIISLLKEKGMCRLRFLYLRFNKYAVKEILKFGILSGLQFSLFSIANLFIQTAVNSFDAVTVEGISAAMNADHLIYDTLAAFYVACATFVSQNFGAQNKKRTLQSFYIALFYAFSIGAILSIILLIFPRQFLSLFTKEALVIDEGVKRLKIMGIAYAFSAFMDTAMAASRGLGKTLIPTIIVVCGSCIFRVIWIYTIFAKYQTMESLFMLYIVSFIITGIAELIYFAYTYKKTFEVK